MNISQQVDEYSAKRAEEYMEGKDREIVTPDILRNLLASAAFHGAQIGLEAGRKIYRAGEVTA